MHHEHVDDILLHTYIHTYICRCSEITIIILCYSCIWGSLRLTPMIIVLLPNKAVVRLAHTKYNFGNVNLYVECIILYFQTLVHVHKSAILNFPHISCFRIVNAMIARITQEQTQKIAVIIDATVPIIV